MPPRRLIRAHRPGVVPGIEAAASLALRRLRHLSSPLIFARGFVDDWRQVGSVVPSSPWLVDALLLPIAWERARVVVELGPGTGVVTRAILRRLRSDGVLLAVEANAGFARHLQATIGDSRLRLVAGDAALLAGHLATAGLGAADAIVSSLPLRGMSPAARDRCLAAAAAGLARHGRFVAYQYTSRLLADMARHFAAPRIWRLWRNLPPAFVFAASAKPD